MAKFHRSRQSGEPPESHRRAKVLSQAVGSLKRLLARYEEVGASRAELESESGLSLGTLKRVLALGLRQGWLENPTRGQYVLKQPGVTIDNREGREGVHGLVLTTLAEPSPLLRIVSDRLRSRPDSRPGETGRWVSVYSDWKNRVVEFRVYRTDRINIYIASTRQPYEWHEVEELAGWLTAWLSPFDSDHLWVVEIGLNVDYKGLRMKGCRAMEWKAWRNAFRQLYEKKGGVRDEIHRWEKPGALSLSVMVRTLKEGSKLAQRERIEKHITEQLRLEAEIERLKAQQATGPATGEKKPRDPAGVLPGEAREGGFG